MMSRRIRQLQNRLDVAVRPVRRVSLLPRESIVTFAFDDFPLSALSAGGTALEQRSARGTFYASFGLAGDAAAGVGSIEDLIAPATRGHEVASHTFGHLDATTTSPAALDADLRTNTATASAHGLTLSNFAFPFGRHHRSSMLICQRHFRTARTTQHAVNRGPTDLYALRAVRLYSRNGINGCRDYIDDITRRPGWLIFYTHDVCETPSSYGCTPRDFEAVVDYTLAAGARIETVAGALDLLL